MAKLVKADVLEPEVGILPSGKGVAFRSQIKRIGNSAALSSAFFGDFHEVWEQEGIDVIWWVRRNCPLEFFKAAVKLAKVLRVEIGDVGAFGQAQSREEILDKMEQRKGPQGRALLEQFLAKLDRMDKDGSDGEGAS